MILHCAKNKKVTLPPYFIRTSCWMDTQEKETFKSEGMSHCCDKYLSQERKDSFIFPHTEQVKPPTVQNLI